MSGNDEAGNDRVSAVLVFFNDTATTEIYTLSLHDALPISARGGRGLGRLRTSGGARRRRDHLAEGRMQRRSEEHTSELQSRQYLVCRLLLEKKNKNPSATAAGSPILS